MKAELRRDGYIEISSETELEGYALSKWLGDWFDKLAEVNPSLEFPVPPIIINTAPTEQEENNK
jgi:hypothetical protein